MHQIKTGKCKSLSGKSTIGYAVGHNDEKELFIKVVTNDGGGFFSKNWVAFMDIINQLEVCPESITSLALSVLYQSKSANSPGFLLATLVSEGLVEPSKTKRRCYQLLDTKPFFEEMKLLTEEGGEKPVRKRESPTPKKPPAPKKTPPKT